MYFQDIFDAYYPPAAAAAAHCPREPAETLAGGSSLARLVAGIHRQAVAPRGYRFAANIGAADRERALLALRYATGPGEVLLEPSAVDDAGNPVAGLALYVRYSIDEPRAFWAMFDTLGESRAAG
jgi:hypothetical protein